MRRGYKWGGRDTEGYPDTRWRKSHVVFMSDCVMREMTGV